MSNTFKTSEGFCQGYTCDQLAYANYKGGYDPKSFPLTVKTKECYCSPCNATSYRPLGQIAKNNPFANLVKEDFSMNQQDAYLGMDRAYTMNNFPKPTGGKSCISIK